MWRELCELPDLTVSCLDNLSLCCLQKRKQSFEVLKCVTDDQGMRTPDLISHCLVCET